MDSSDDKKWVSFSLTHVEYPKGDLFGKILAVSSLFPVFIVCSLVTLVLFRREMHTVTFLIGQLGNEVLNYVIKHIVKEKRPSMRDLSNMHVKYGWPSSHAQFIWFFAFYLTLFVNFRCHNRSISPCFFNVWKLIVTTASFCLAGVVTYSRVYLGYHTLNQVVWGAAIGSVVSLIWFVLTQFVFAPLFPMFVHSKLGEFFMIRDSSLIPDVLWFEYTISRNEARVRSRKMSISKNQ